MAARLESPHFNRGYDVPGEPPKVAKASKFSPFCLSLSQRQIRCNDDSQKIESKALVLFFGDEVG